MTLFDRPCPACGERCQWSDRFCPACGEAIRHPKPGGIFPPSPVVAGAWGDRRVPRTRWLWAAELAVLGVVAAVVAVVVLA